MRLACIRPANWPEPHIDEVYDQVPDGFAYIEISLHTLTSTVTVLTAEFGLDEDRARGLEGILNQDFATHAKMQPPGGYTILDAKTQKARRAEEWRVSLRRQAVSWLSERFPGSFDRLAPGQLPTIELLLTGQHQPWQADSQTGTAGWARMLDIGGTSGYWQCASPTSLRLGERRSGPQSEQRHRLVLASAERELLADQADSASGLEAIPLLGFSVATLLTRWSLSAFIRELEEQLASIQDAAQQSARRRAPHALADTQQLLLRNGIDSRIVVNDIVRFAQDSWWRYNLIEFTEVDPPGVRDSRRPPASLADSLRGGQITDGQRVSRLETDLRDILSTSADLTSASENIRLQRRVVWLTIISVIAAIVAAAAAVIAITRSNGPATAPSAHTAHSSATAPSRA
jgi:hypothetical protein